MRPTMKDVAERCGVTDATVSYVLNNRKGVSAETRERVLRTMREMRYHPSAIARGLSQRRMNTIGVVFYLKEYAGLLNSPYFAAVLDGILNGAVQNRQKTLLFLERNWEEGMRESTDYLDGHCDGLIFVSPIDASQYVATLFERGIPYVFIGDSGVGGENSICSVDVDNILAARELTQHLIELGHKRIAFLAGDIPVSSVVNRIAGYRQALEQSGLMFDERWVLPGGYNQSSGYDRTHTLMRTSGELRPTALFCCSDLIAYGALKALTEMGIRVPKDVSVVGFDDLEDSAKTLPPLTTMRQPLREIGERAMDIVLKQIGDRQVSSEQVYLATRLIVRDSVQPPS